MCVYCCKQDGAHLRGCPTLLDLCSRGRHEDCVMANCLCPCQHGAPLSVQELYLIRVMIAKARRV